MNKRNICIIIVISLLIISFSNCIIPVKSDTTETILWLSADWHMDRADTENAIGHYWNTDQFDPDWDGGYMFGNVMDAVNDSNSMNIDYAWIVGDMISWHDYNAGYDGYVKSWDRFDIAWENLTVNYHKNWSIGNHDGGWWNQTSDISKTPRASGAGGQWYYYDIGNTSGGGIRVICMADEDTKNGGTHTGDMDISSTQRNWVGNIVDDAYDNNLSVFILSHTRVENNWFPNVSIYPNANNDQTDAYDISNIMNYWNGQGKPISLFACGHQHVDAINEAPSATHEVYYGCDCVLLGSMVCYESGTGDAIYPSSRYIHFTEDSTTATVKTYDHYNDVWDSGAEFSITLQYPWSPAEEPEYTFTDICGEQNNSNITSYDSVWGNLTNPEASNIPGISSNQILEYVEYNIRVATDASFSSIIANEIHYSTWFTLSTNISNQGGVYFDYRTKVKVVSN